MDQRNVLRGIPRLLVSLSMGSAIAGMCQIKGWVGAAGSLSRLGALLLIVFEAREKFKVSICFTALLLKLSMASVSASIAHGLEAKGQCQFIPSDCVSGITSANGAVV
jgi:hypothetical protein